jgi:ribosome-associated translation inhibitor RaiA
MEIVFHAHHAQISDYLRRRAERGVEKLARRVDRATTAVVRVVNDATIRRVEIELDAPGRRLVGKGEAKHFGPALTEALAAISRQVSHVKGAHRAHTRREAMTRRVQEA